MRWELVGGTRSDDNAMHIMQDLERLFFVKS